jgi:hypothetical protein
VKKGNHLAETGGAEEGGDSGDEAARESAQQEKVAEGADGAKRKYDGWVATAYGACLIVGGSICGRVFFWASMYPDANVHVRTRASTPVS